MRAYLIFLLSFFGAASVSAQQDTVVESLLRDVPVWMAENHVPCTGIGIIENGRIKWLHVFGQLSQGHPAPTNTLFNIASQTKPVTAMLVLKLVQAGLWNLDEPLSHYWIDPDIAGSPYLDKLTTRIVLSHQTGFPNWRSGKLAFNFEPGTKFGYSGEGFEYLRRALESKFHKSLSTLMAAYLWTPLGLRNTQYWNDRLDTSRFAVWHDGVGHPYAVSMHTPVNAADDLITTVEDYCQLGIAVVKGLGLPDTLSSEMSRPQVKIKDNYYRALGWGLVDGLPGGEYAFEHGGSDIGVRTMALFLPKSKSGIVVMTNADNGIFVIDQVIRRALPAGAQIQAIMNKGASAHERISIADSLIRGYTGDYIQQNGKALKIEQAGNAIKVSGDGAPTATLYPESSNKFFLEGYDVQMEFPDAQTLVVYEGGKQVLVAHRAVPADRAGGSPDLSRLQKDMSAIASDSTEGRFTGSAGYLKAAKYIVAQLKAAGVKPGSSNGYLQPVPFIWDDYTGSSLLVKGSVFPHDAQNFVVVSRGAARPGKWVVLSAGDSVKGDPTGVILLPNANQSRDWETTVIRQYRFGYMHYVPDEDRIRSSSANRGTKAQRPVILLSPSLAGHLAPGDSIDVVFAHRPEHLTGYNVIGILPGSTKAPAIVVGSHLDHIGRIGNHIYNGANDDASGCVAELGVAKMLATHPLKRTVVFTFFCGEELNLKGSDWYVNHLPATPIGMMINLEQLGSKHRSIKGVAALGDTAFKARFYQAGVDLASNDLAFSATDSVREELANTDTDPFIRKGIPSVLLGSGGFDEHHTVLDKIDLIDFDHLQKATDLLYRFILLY